MKINCHCHIFSLDYVPKEFRNRFMLDSGNPLHRFIHRLLKIILPNGSKLETFFDFALLTISEIADRLVQEMDEAGIEICTPLMMDMEFCQAFGGGVKSFEAQVGETIEAVEAVNKTHGRTRMLSFIAADPRRKDVVEIVTDALQQGAFKGVKIYPIMGFTPDDRRLFPIYEYCMRNEIPVTTHCENGGIPGFGNYYYLAHPKYWRNVLSNFPDLKLNLAHNDRTGSTWQPVIRDLIVRYPKVYTDISYDREMFYKPARYFKSIKTMLNTPKLQDRILYGTDWYMGRYLWTEASYLNWFTAYPRRIPWCRIGFTEEEMTRLMEENPMSFLCMNRIASGSSGNLLRGVASNPNQ